LGVAIVIQTDERDEGNGQPLVGHSDFFPDHELLAALETTAVPWLFAGKASGASVRVWVPGCGTGAVAYAISILLCEYAAQFNNRPRIEIFATDSDEAAIAIARKGLEADMTPSVMSPELLLRFKQVPQHESKLKKLVRELIVFAVHDVLHDPPFARLDLIVCPNLLSRFGEGQREQLLRVFHHVLRSDGFLALGVGEPTTAVEGLFIQVGDMPHLFQRRNVSPTNAIGFQQRQDTDMRPPSLAAQPSDIAAASSRRDLHLRLLAQHGATSVLTDESYEIAHLSKSDNRLFQIPAGVLSYNLLDVIHPELRPLLRVTLLSAASMGASVETPPVWVRLNGVTRQIRMLAWRLHEPEWARGYFLVIFDEYGAHQAGDRAHGDDDTPAGHQVEADRQDSQSQWKLAINQYEIAIEEQRIVNNQLQTANEKQQALTEELATSQEQLSTVNEELRSSNEELRRQVLELMRANNDLNNLISAADIPTIFLDRALQITRFTPQAQHLFNLIFGDRGRPLTHITHRLDYDQLLPDIANVLKTLQGIEREVPSKDGRWYLARLRVYRTADEQIEGVVLTFVDITARKQAEEALRQARDELELRVVERTHDLATANLHLQDEIAERMRLEVERKELLRKVVTMQEDERRRIARELHDQLGQSVSALGIGLAVLANPAIEAGQRQETLARLQQIAVQIDKDINRLAIGLRPTALDDLGLIAAVRYHVEQWAEHNGIHAEFQASGLSTVRLSGEIETVIYRVIQEALTNVLKHAAAQRVGVILERRSDQVSLIVEDDGRGFDLDALRQMPSAQRRLGLLGMQERVAIVGGTFTIDTAPGVGTTLFARIPISP
jgi:two-component system, chemotaxis family, CheB/CheR fusion protein